MALTGKGSFRQALLTKKFVITVEAGLPKGTNVNKFVEHVRLLKDRVDAINVTDNQRSVMRFPSIGGCLIIKEEGGEPILQMTCRDRNRLALGAELLLASSRGIRNIVCLTGDAMAMGDQPQAKAVFDLDSVQLIQMVKGFEKGIDPGNNRVEGDMEFCVGAAATPEADPIQPQLIKFEKKIEGGAEFFQTQAVYDMNSLRYFMEHARRFPVKILAGIVLLTSAKMAQYLNENVPGVNVPKRLIGEMASVARDDQLKKGIEIALQMIHTIKEESLCDGVHIMAMNREEVIPQIIREIT